MISIIFWLNNFAVPLADSRLCVGQMCIILVRLSTKKIKAGLPFLVLVRGPIKATFMVYHFPDEGSKGLISRRGFWVQDFDT